MCLIRKPWRRRLRHPSVWGRKQTSMLNKKIVGSILFLIGSLSLIRLWVDFPIHFGDKWVVSEIKDVTERPVLVSASSADAQTWFRCAEWDITVRLPFDNLSSIRKLQHASCATTATRERIVRLQREGLLVAYQPESNDRVVAAGLFDVREQSLLISIAAIGVCFGIYLLVVGLFSKIGR